MFTFAITPDAAGSLVWLVATAAAAFLVTWVLTDVLGVRRTMYIAFLAALTGALAALYAAWGADGAASWSHQWTWGVLGAVVAGGILAMAARRMPADRQLPGSMRAARVLWEAVIYGSAEGVLLSVLPVLIAWQALTALGWNGVAAGAAAMAASAVVVVIHHLGYAEFRNRKLAFALVGCLPLSLAFLLTASPIAAVGGHIILHSAMLRRGVELPPQVVASGRAAAGVRTRHHETETVPAH